MDEKQSEEAKPWFFRTKVQSANLTEEQDKHLVQTYSNLYRARHTTRYGLRWGFEIEAGWYKLIEATSALLEAEILKEPEDKRPDFHAQQVKPKFCSLRFYMSDTTPAMDSIIFEAEKKSQHTCEVCGSGNGDLIYPPFELIEEMRGWRRRVCHEHFRQLAEEDSWWVWDKEVPADLQEKFKQHYWKHLTP